MKEWSLHSGSRVGESSCGRLDRAFYRGCHVKPDGLPQSVCQNRRKSCGTSHPCPVIHPIRLSSPFLIGSHDFHSLLHRRPDTRYLLLNRRVPQNHAASNIDGFLCFSCQDLGYAGREVDSARKGVEGGTEGIGRLVSLGPSISGDVLWEQKTGEERKILRLAGRIRMSQAHSENCHWMDRWK